jgi:hypothetical protein
LTEPLDESFAQRTEVWHGKQEITRRGLDELSKVKTRYDSIVDHNGPSIMINNEFVMKAYADVRNRGCSIRLITEISKANVLYCKELAKVLELRHFDGIKGNLGIVDGISYGASARSEERQFPTEYIYSTVKSFVEQQQYFFDMLWNKAIPGEQKIMQIEEGIEPEVIETIRDHDEIQKTAFNLVRIAHEEILITFPISYAFYTEEQLGIMKPLNEISLSNPGINIRVLTALSNNTFRTEHNNNTLDKDRENKQERKRYSKNIVIRELEQPLQSKLSLIIVDRKYSLAIEIKQEEDWDGKQVIKKGKGKSAYNNHGFRTQSTRMGLATYSNSKSTVLSYASIFDTLWNQILICHIIISGNIFSRLM